MSVVEHLLDTARADTDLLLQNGARGDDFAKPRVVDNLLLSDEQDQANLVRDFVNDNRYGDAVVESVDGCFRELVQIEMPTTQSVLCSVSGLMVCLAASHGLEFDGWGCVLQSG